MCKICVFAGTTEGRELVEFLCEQPISVTACVATEYGETLLPHAENLTVSAKRLDQSEMVAMLSQNAFDLVVDATHPYAEVVTENIAAAWLWRLPAGGRMWPWFVPATAVFMVWLP